MSFFFSPQAASTGTIIAAQRSNARIDLNFFIAFPFAKIIFNYIITDIIGFVYTVSAEKLLFWLKPMVYIQLIV